MLRLPLVCTRLSRIPLPAFTLGNRTSHVGVENLQDTGLFVSIGIDNKKAKEAATSPTLSKSLKLIIQEAGVYGGCAREIGTLLYTLATKLPSSTPANQRGLLSKWVVAKKLTSVPQLNAAVEYLRSKEVVIEDELEKHCGVGVVVTEQTIKKVAQEVLQAKHNVQSIQQRRAQGLGPPLGDVLQQVRTHPACSWADGATLRAIVEQELQQIFQNVTPGLLPQSTQREDSPVVPIEDPSPIPKNLIPPSESIRFPSPQENKQTTAKLLEDHLKFTGGKIVTRFPPEPNGYLHIGHAKAMHLDFGYADKNGGKCYLRFDDTNPETEKQEYIESIIENIEWLGYKVAGVTYSSKYFQELYDLAVELINRNKAYTPNEIATCRNMRPVQPSPYRDRPKEESLKIFKEMRAGLWKEGTATLRMKMELTNPNPCMWDLVAYRIKFMAHPITGDEWCVSQDSNGNSLP